MKAKRISRTKGPRTREPRNMQEKLKALRVELVSTQDQLRRVSLELGRERTCRALQKYDATKRVDRILARRAFHPLTGLDLHVVWGGMTDLVRIIEELTSDD